MYYVGMTEYSSWAITTSQGIILIDAIYDYSVEDEVDGGLKKLGLKPCRHQVRAHQPRATSITRVARSSCRRNTARAS